MSTYYLYSFLSIKLSFLAADLAICGLLSARFGALRAALYAWNPLVIYGISGGGHYDSWFLLPLVAAWLLAERIPPPQEGRPQAWVDLLLGLSVAFKWITLPLLLQRIWSRWRQFRQPAPPLTTLLLGLAPLLLGTLWNRTSAVTTGRYRGRRQSSGVRK